MIRSYRNSAPLMRSECSVFAEYAKEGVLFMREQKYHIYLDSHERKLLIHSLVELKNQLIQQGRYTDCVDELVFKVINAPTKRMKIEYV